MHFLRGAALLSLCAAFLPTGQAAQNRTDWADYGGGPDNSHYVPLNQITKDNVNDLKVAWTYPTQDNASYIFNPVVVGNVMYVLARDTSLVAVDATTGKEIWVHENLAGIAGRGINYWESTDHKDRRLVFQIRNQLQEIDAATGKSILTFGNNGYVDLREGLGRDIKTVPRIQSGTPGKIYQNLIILGSSTGENFISPPGDIRAYDILTGKLAWQFHTLPHPGEFGFDTWPKDAWKYVGGVNTWGEMSLDDKRGIVYLPLGSGTYDFYGSDRKGNDLFADCLLALDAKTGKYKWHFQEVHHDLWDYDAVSAPQLITIKHNGKNVDAVAHAGKTGFLYVLDRVTGKPIWPIEERKTPKSEMAGEYASPTQPYPTVPPPFARQKFTADDINPYLPVDERNRLRDRVASARNEGLFTPPGLRESVEMPGNRGGSNWGTTAGDPPQGMVFVVSVDAPSLLKLSPEQPVGGGIVNPYVAGGGRGPAATSPGQIVYQRNCQGCHGANREGAGQIPSLVDVTTRMGADVIHGIVQNGSGQMPAFSEMSDTDFNALIDFLANPTGSRGGRGVGRGAAPPPSPGGPVVASGGAPAGTEAAAAYVAGPSFGLMDGPAYPAGVIAPNERYFTGWNVMYNIIDPPWNTLTAYDLNKGTIAWQATVGDDPGLLTEQRGVMVTSTGLVFMASGDGKIRAFDEQTGKVLWTSELPAGSRGIPAMYEVNGKPYIVVSATSPITRGNGNPAASPGPAQAIHRGYVAYSLPNKPGSSK